MAFDTTLSAKFFSELKQYNRTNFKNLHSADISVSDANVVKAFSSVITRYFIFCEKHPEISDNDLNILWFKLKLDMVARFFSNYPNTDADDLVAFQQELRTFVNGGGEDVSAVAV